MKYEKRGFFPRMEIDWIVKEFDRIKWHAVKFTEMMAEPVIEDVDKDIELIVDDNAAPFVRDTMGSLKKTAQKIADKYKDDLSDDGSHLHQAAESILHTNGFDPCGEVVYCWLFKYDFSQENEELIKDVEKLKEAVYKAHHGYKVGGIYDHKTKKITLFSRNLDGREDYVLTFAQTFFDAVYRYMLDANGSTEKLDRYYHEVVIGSLSECFKIHYVNEFSCDFTVTPEKLIDSLIGRSPIYDPFCCGAKLFNKRYNLDSFHYIRILEASYYDFKDALRKMVDNYEYKVIIRKKKPNKINGLPSKMSPYSTGSAVSKNKKVKEKRYNFGLYYKRWENMYDDYDDVLKYGRIEENSEENSGSLIHKVKRGDVIFNIKFRKIISVSIALKDSCLKDGIWSLPVDTHEVEYPVEFDENESFTFNMGELVENNRDDGFLVFLERQVKINVAL